MESGRHTRSASGISMAKKRDPQNIADPLVPAVKKSAVRKANKSAASVKASATRSRKVATAQDEAPVLAVNRSAVQNVSKVMASARAGATRSGKHATAQAEDVPTSPVRPSGDTEGPSLMAYSSHPRISFNAYARAITAPVTLRSRMTGLQHESSARLDSSQYQPRNRVPVRKPTREKAQDSDEDTGAEVDEAEVDEAEVDEAEVDEAAADRAEDNNFEVGKAQVDESGDEAQVDEFEVNEATDNEAEPDEAEQDDVDVEGVQGKSSKFLSTFALPVGTRMMGYQPQPISNPPRSPNKQGQVKSTWTRPSLQRTEPRVLVPNSSESSLDIQEEGMSKTDGIQPEVTHRKAVLRSELKKDVQMNTVFEEIRAEFYLLAITKDLFIENSPGFKGTLKQLASAAFTRLEIPPFELTDSLMVTFSRDLKSWRNKLKMHALSLIPPYYGVGSNMESSFAKKNVELALHRGNFAFRLFDCRDRSGALEHPAIAAILDFTFGLRELRLPSGSPRDDLKSKLQHLSVETFAYTLTMIMYVLNQHESGTVAKSLGQFSFCDYSDHWTHFINQFRQWSMKPDRADDWERVSSDLGYRAIMQLGIVEGDNIFTLLDTD